MIQEGLWLSVVCAAGNELFGIETTQLPNLTCAVFGGYAPLTATSRTPTQKRRARAHRAQARTLLRVANASSVLPFHHSAQRPPLMATKPWTWSATSGKGAHRCGTSPQDRANFKLFQGFLAYQKSLEESQQGQGRGGKGGEGGGKGSGKSFQGQGAPGKGKGSSEPALPGKDSTRQPASRPVQPPSQGPIRVCSSCGTDHNSQDLTRCRNKRCRKPLPLDEEQQASRPLRLLTREPEFLALHNKYADLAKDSQDGAGEATDASADVEAPAAPCPVKLAEERLNHLRVHPHMFAVHIKAAEEDLKKAREDKANASGNIAATSSQHDLSLLYKKLDDLSSSYETRKSKLLASETELKQQRQELEAKLEDNQAYLGQCESDYAAQKAHVEGLLKKALAKAKDGGSSEPASAVHCQPGPQVTLPPDMDLALVVPEILPAVDTFPLGQSQKDVLKVLLNFVTENAKNMSASKAPIPATGGPALGSQGTQETLRPLVNPEVAAARDGELSMDADRQERDNMREEEEKPAKHQKKS